MKSWGLVFAAGAVGVLSGCRSPDYRPPAERQQPVRECRQKDVRDKFEYSLRLAPDTADANIEARFSCDVQRPADKTLAKFVDAALAEAYHHARGEERRGVAASGVQGVREAFFDDYREWFAEDWDGVAKGDFDKHVACWNCHVEGRIEYCDKRYFSYRVTIDTYCGGAHGYRWVQNATYSRKDGRRLKATDVIRRESMTAVINLIRKAVRKETRDDSLREQLKEEIRQPYDEYVRDIRGRRRDEWGNPLVTDNFMITQGGIAWVYNQYEIACYAAGIFEVQVTWAALGPHLCDRNLTCAIPRTDH